MEAPLDTRDRLAELIKDKCILHGDFTLASGQKSTVYFDCKRATLDPEGLHLIATLLLEIIDRLEDNDGQRVDAIGGPTIGADPVVGHVAGRSWERAEAGEGHPVRPCRRRHSARYAVGRRPASRTAARCSRSPTRVSRGS